MRWRIVEAKTVQDTGALYLLVHFWQGDTESPYLINDFIFALPADVDIEPIIRDAIAEYWQRASEAGFEGDHSFKVAADLKARGEIVRLKGTRVNAPRLSAHDPYGWVRKAKALR